MGKGLRGSVICGLIALLSVNSLLGQQLDHVQGEFLLKLTENTSRASASAQLAQQHSDIFELKECISTLQNIWLVQFDHNRYNEYQLLEQIRALPAVQVAQFNHLVHDRKIPNDQFFDQQWHYTHPTNDQSHFHAAKAWDVTTGGISPYGDTIVVCIIDSGFDPKHRDLAANIYKNYQEIPNNGQDDDNNGYVDDHRGWNVALQNDAIGNGGPSSTHGTPLCGITGAIGNNRTGVVGVNWNVKMMLIVRGITESKIIQAYEYPLKARRAYNRSRGKRGAFVVATNTSWGLDNKFPSDSPLWCAMYDSLGQEGVLNIGATTNRNVDVGLTGDLPTTCTSDFLITVTNIDQGASKVQNAGYSPQHIDIAAFGEQIFTTLSNDQYGLYSGTSAAAPHVTASVGLLYAAPCPGLSELARIDPTAAALRVRDYLLTSARPNSSLANFTTRSSQLDINESIQAVVADCDVSECFNPYQLQIDPIDDRNVLINWVQVDVVQQVDLRYKAVGSSNWIEFSNVQSPFQLLQLLSCTSYELQIRSKCGSQVNDYSRSYFFKTGNCCEAPTDLAVKAISDSSVVLSWPSIPSSLAYLVHYRAVGDANWIERNAVDTSLLLDGLSSCSSFECQVLSLCDNNSLTAPSLRISFQTSGCGSCLDNSYCIGGVSNDNNDMWISRLVLEDIDKSSDRGSDDGYSNYTEEGAVLIPGYAHPIQLELKANFQILSPTVTVWIDLNQNGQFEEPLERLIAQRAESSPFRSTLVIPSWVPEGNTRLRIAVRDGQYPACGVNGLLGEVEDYCVSFASTNDCLVPVNLEAKTIQNTTQLSWNSGSNVGLFTIRYRPLDQNKWTFANSSQPSFSLQDLLDCRNYICQVSSFCDFEQSNYSAPIFFTTDGCGVCLDAKYCEPQGDATFEWISSVRIQGVEQNSGSNGGFAYFSDAPINIFRGEPLAIQLQAAWQDNPTEAIFSVWIDSDHNGKFHPQRELLFQGPTARSGSPLDASCSIPANALNGSTRLRVRMQHNQNPADACQEVYFGETEDYCINILDSIQQSCSTASALQIQSGNDNQFSVSWLGIQNAHSYELRYRPSDLRQGWISIYTSRHSILLDQLEDCTEYQLQLRSICQSGLGKFSPIASLTTQCVTTSTKSPNQASEAFLYPNPCVDQFWVQTNGPIDLLNIYNTKGQLLQSIASPNAATAISLPSELSAGIYLVRIWQSDRWQTLKLLKKHTN